MSLTLFFFWRSAEPLTQIGWTLRNGWRDVALGAALFIPLFLAMGAPGSALRPAAEGGGGARGCAGARGPDARVGLCRPQERRRALPLTRGRPKAPPVVFTIGHSTRPLEAFLGMLRAHGVQRVVDVRSVPRSRHNPQFNRDTLPTALRSAGIRYVHLPALGGLRRARPDSPNTAWRNASFRGFADYMQTPEFAAGLRRLMALARKERIVLMCAEAVPWRCHRSLIADALTAWGIPVEHIASATRPRPHTLTPWAQVRGGGVIYPGEATPPGVRRRAASHPQAEARDPRSGRSPASPSRRGGARRPR